MMKILALLATVFLTQNVGAQTATNRPRISVVYGEENRKDVYQVRNQLYLELAKSTAGMIHISLISKNKKPGTFFDLLYTKSLAITENLCSNQVFAKQKTAATCSGFLVAPDILVTAGHCYLMGATAKQTCEEYAWIFDYSMKTASANPNKNIPLKNIYTCKKVIAAQLDKQNDYSIIKLNRPVTDRAPLKFRKVGKIPSLTKLLTIGHPSGLPTKIADGGKITRNMDKNIFSANLDTFHGNSGSAVFDANSGLIEGILIQGNDDYLPSNPSDENSCRVVNTCNDQISDCTNNHPKLLPFGESVLRITNISKIIEQASMY